MRDNDIRNILLKSFKKQFASERETVIVEELGLCQGDARVDIAIVNGSLHGHEIKSDKDSLRRLQAQKDIYGKVLDYVTITSSSRHLAKIRDMIPFWWGINEVKNVNGKHVLIGVRRARKNQDTEPDSVVQLLWRDEAFEVLKARNLHKGLVSKPRAILWQAIVKQLSFSELKDIVRRTIKTRQNWRPVLRQR